MNAHRIMIFQYATMFGLPLLFVITAIVYALHLSIAYIPLEALLMLALFVYGAVGYLEIYLHQRYGLDRLPVEEGEAHVYAGEKRERRPGLKAVTLRVKRFNNEAKVLEEHSYKVYADRFTSVLDALLGVKGTADPTLSMRYSCRMGICGSCGMDVNGKPALACEANVFKTMRGGEVEVAPMLGHPLLKDLVTDFDDFFEKHKSVEPHLFRDNTMEKYNARQIYKQNMREENAYLPFSFCIMCGLCLDACPVVNSNPRFIGPQALSQAYRYHKDTRDQMGGKRLDLIDDIEGVWGCEFIGACSDVCPKGVDPALSIQLLKGEVMRHGLLSDYGKQEKQK